MDPDAALHDAHKALAEYRSAQDHENSGDAQTHAEELADAFEALDEWLTQGGFLPKDWQGTHVVLVGNPAEGFHVLGPFRTEHVADAYADEVEDQPLNAITVMPLLSTAITPTMSPEARERAKALADQHVKTPDFQRRLARLDAASPKRLHRTRRPPRTGPHQRPFPHQRELAPESRITRNDPDAALFSNLRK